ncbi:MAG TPA: hypothetical protein VFM65_01200 [Flavobacteriaceae bacterium]|nr:hypothetical protein [Flavobacteriaceae bacterium]
MNISVYQHYLNQRISARKISRRFAQIIPLIIAEKNFNKSECYEFHGTKQHRAKKGQAFKVKT